ncbi:MAG TPA: hypothetical protein VFE62_16795 [Gemmataceae bacterium]|nr:hypothetical protein [Gemmataceae bacterium]
MSWAQHKIDQYRQGKPATWLEQRMLEHAEPVHFVAAWIAAFGLIYGLWIHDWSWIIGSMLLAIFGHIYSWMWRRGK